MIPPLGGGGREFESRNGPERYFFAQLLLFVDAKGSYALCDADEGPSILSTSFFLLIFALLVPKHR